MSLLSVKNLSVDFPSHTGIVSAVRDVSFDVQAGETFGIIGESGSGKSVISLAILKLLPANAVVQGSVGFFGEDVLALSGEAIRSIRGRRISLMPQNPSLSLNPVLNNGRQLFEVFGLQGVSPKEWHGRSISILDKLLLTEPKRVLRQYPHQLSGGMKQRLLASIALSFNPVLLLADEPTKGLDPEARRSSIELLKSIKKAYGRTMIVITHDLELARELCDRIAVMYSGEIVEIGPAEQVIQSPSHPYTQGLVGALPRNGLVPLEGQSPSRVCLPTGCFFHERCSHRQAGCAARHPGIVDHAGGSVRCNLYC